MSTSDPEMTITKVTRIIVYTDDGYERDITFPPSAQGRYRIRRNRMMGPGDKVVREFKEHEIFWSEDWWS